MKPLSGSIRPYVLIVIVGILAYWPVSFMLFSVKNDAINYFFAMRFHISESIQYGIFPGWSPYINLGYPMQGDIQSGSWNPLVILMSLFRTYDIFWFHIEVVLVNIIAGAGMFRLLSYLGLNLKACLAIAIAYMLNGYLADAGQFINWQYSAALLPFVLLYALKAFSGFKGQDAFKLGLAFSMMLLCGYPADSILCAYLLTAWWLISLIASARSRNRKIQAHFRVAFLALITFVIISLPALVSYIEYFNLVRRGQGVSLELAQSNSLAPANLISLAFPWVTLKGHIFSATDPLIRNCFIGLLPLLFVFYFFSRRPRLNLFDKFLVGVIVFFFLFILGRFSFLRGLTYDFLPFMDTFRHPANAKLFLLFALQLFAAKGIHLFLLEKDRPILFKKLITVGLFISVALLILALTKSELVGELYSLLDNKGVDTSTILKKTRDSFTGWDFLLLNSILALVYFLVVFVLHQRNLVHRFVTLLITLEMALALQMMIPLTYVRNYSVREINNLLDKYPRGYPLPELSSTLAQNSREGMKYFKEIGCLNVYNKKIGRSDYIISPSNIAAQDEFWEDSIFRTRVMDKPFVYLADSVYTKNEKEVFVNKHNTYSAYMQGEIGDSVFNHTASLNCLEFYPNRMDFEIVTAGKSLLVFHQNHYPRWKALLDGDGVEIKEVNGPFMSVNVPPGKHEVSFRYYMKDLRLLTMASLLFLTAGMVWIYYPKWRKH